MSTDICEIVSAPDAPKMLLTSFRLRGTECEWQVTSLIVAMGQNQNRDNRNQET